MTETGRVIAVNTATFGDELVDDTLTGATSLVVTDAADFSEDGGFLSLNDVVLAYDSVDDETGTITLSSPTTADALSGDAVYVWDDEAGAVAVETIAFVEAEGADSNDDALEAVVPHALIPYLPEGIRTTAGESVILEQRGGDLVVADVLLRTPAFDGTVIDPSTLPPPAPSDGLAPGASPTPSVVGGVGTLFVKWTPVENVDPVTYDVHVSATTPVAIDATTKVAETVGSLVTVRTLADGSDLEYETTYYVAVVARDEDGPAPASTEASGSPAQVTSADLVVDFLTSNMLTANEALVDALNASDITAVTLTGATFQTRAEPARGIKVDSRFVAYDESGVPFLVVDPAAGMAIVAGQVNAGTVTATEGASLGGTTELTRAQDGSAGRLRMTAGTTAPKAAPTVLPYYEQIALEPTLVDFSTMYGFSVGTISGGDGSIPDGTYYFTLYQWSEAFEGGQMRLGVWNTDGTFVKELTVTGSTGGALLGVPRGMTYNGTNFWVIYQRWDAIGQQPDDWWVYKYDQNFDYLDDWQPTFLDNGNKRAAAIGWDALDATRPLKIAQSDKFDGNVVKVYSTTETGGSLLTVDTDIVSTNSIASIICGQFDFPAGAHVWVISRRGSSDHNVFTSFGTEDLGRTWPSGLGSKAGTTWDGSKFLTLGLDGYVQVYTGLTSDIPGDPVQQKWVTYTLANATYETDESPVGFIDLPKRAGLKVSVNPINTADGGPTNPDRIHVYVGEDTNDPTNRWLQPDPAVGEITWTGSSLAVGTSNAPTSNGFPNGTAQVIEAANDSFYIDGDGNGDVGLGSFRDSVIGATRPPGEVTMYVGTTAPVGWLLCDGSSLLRTSYPDLAAALGSPVGGGTGPFGAADSDHFNLPDLRGRVPMGPGGATSGALGSNEGETDFTARTANHTHGTGSLATGTTGSGHTHGIPNQDGGTSVTVAQGGATNIPRFVDYDGHHHGGDTTTSGSAHTHNVTGDTGTVVGSGTANVPFLSVNFIVKT